MDIIIQWILLILILWGAFTLNTILGTILLVWFMIGILSN